jgi:hypothetical protein
MEFDFCLVASWGETVHRQLFSWGKELTRRGYQVAILSPSDRDDAPRDISFFSFSDLPEMEAVTREPADIEREYDIPSFDQLVFTEQKYFHLSRETAVERGLKITNVLEQFLSDHTVHNTVQARGPEIHRMLMHHLTISAGGTSIWAGFSPFENTFGLRTTLDGTWDTYETVPYQEMDDDERERTRDHFESYLSERRSHRSPSESKTQVIPTIRSALSKAAGRERPGRLHDQVREELRLKGQRIVNKRLFPDADRSKRMCEKEQYLLFPLQYPIESRLTVFSPQFFRQEHLVEYFSRILPASVELFIKPHPNHPGRPGPKTVRKLQQHDRIRMIHPSLNIHTAIENSAGVIVTNNTVGFQTLYYQKPLFVLGNEFYAETPAAITPSNLGCLSESLSAHLFEEAPLSTVLSSIYSLRKASYPGNRADTSPEGAATIIDSIEQFCADIDEA